MNILYYGYGNHAKKIQKIVRKYFNHSLINEVGIVRNGLNRDFQIPVFLKLDDAIDLYGRFDIAFIATSNNYHLSAFIECVEKSIPFIYIEKPALQIEEYCLQNSLFDSKTIKYVQIGYHMRYIDQFKELKTSITDHHFGDLVQIDIKSGKGIAFKSDFSGSWRASRTPSIVKETIASHFLNLIIFLLPDASFDNISMAHTCFANKELYDTFSASICIDSAVHVNILASWAIPLHSSVKLIFTDAIWEYDFQELTISTPRDSFDSDGLFKSPPCITEKSPSGGLRNSIYNFLNISMNNSHKDFDLNNASFTAKFL